MHPVPSKATPASTIAINTFVIFIFAISLSARGRNRRARFAHGSDGLNALAHTDWHEPGIHDANGPNHGDAPWPCSDDRDDSRAHVRKHEQAAQRPHTRRWMDNHRRRRNDHGRRAIMVIVPQRNAEAEPIGTRVHGGYTQAGYGQSSEQYLFHTHPNRRTYSPPRSPCRFPRNLLRRNHLCTAAR